MKRIEISRSMYSTANAVYIIKCLTGILICYGLYKYIPQYPFYWAMVSASVSLSIDNSTDQAFNFMKSNILGCAVGITLYPLHLPEILILSIGIVSTICIGIALNITETLRSALVSLGIVIVKEEQEKHWFVALERVTCIIVGCVVGLLVTVFFSFIMQRISRKNT
jgi:uncharacterized membrane protein YgaE (UPF0421/DUF939 family)